MVNYSEMIDNYLKKCSGRAIDVFYELYQFVEPLDSSEQALAIKHICENAEEIDSDGSYTAKNHFSELQLSKIDSKFRKKNLFEKINDLALSSAINAVNPIEFYSSVWALIVSLTTNSTRERALALFALSKCELVPYRSIGTGISMEDDEYRQLIGQIDSALIDNVEYIFKLHYPQKTQLSSLLLDWLLCIKDKRAQVVFLSIVINNLKRTTREKIMSAIDNVD